MVEALLTAHWAVRYVVLLAGLAALAVTIMRMAQRDSARAAGPGRADRITNTVFIASLDAQVVLGVGLLLTRPFYPALMGHLTMMVLAVAVAHAFSAVLRRRPPEQRSLTAQLAGILLPLVLIVGGILAIGRPVV